MDSFVQSGSGMSVKDRFRVVVISGSEDDTKEVKKKLAPIFNSIADKHDIPVFVDGNGDDIITDEDEWYGLSDEEGGDL